MGRLTAQESRQPPSAFRVFRVCSMYVEQSKPLISIGLLALFRVFDVYRARVTREPVTRARAHYSFLPRVQRGNTWNTWNALYPCGLQRSGYLEQTWNTNGSEQNA